MGVRETVRNAIQALAQGPVPDDDSTSLFTEGVIDSFSLVELMAELETSLGVKIPDAELMPSRFETVAKIVQYFEARR